MQHANIINKCICPHRNISYAIWAEGFALKKNVEIQEIWNLFTAWQNRLHKKVLLRERKRHTARHVVSTPSVVLPGTPPPAGYPPVLAGWGVPYLGPPPAGYPPWQVTPPAGPGRVPPRLPNGILGNVAKHYGIWVPPCGQTDRHVSKHYLPVVLRTRAVKTDSFKVICIVCENSNWLLLTSLECYCVKCKGKYNETCRLMFN